MACHHLRSGWTQGEVDARLGHTHQSKALNAYINCLAIDRERRKKRLFDSSLEEFQNALEETKRREKLSGDRIRRQGEENEPLKGELRQTSQDVAELKAMIAKAMANMS